MQLTVDLYLSLLYRANYTNYQHGFRSIRSIWYIIELLSIIAIVISSPPPQHYHQLPWYIHLQDFP